MDLRYIPDADFHAGIDAELQAEGVIGTANQEARDLFITETRLAVSGIWPASWEGLMSDHDKERLIAKILAERRGRYH